MSEISFACNRCHKIFNRKQHLQNHMKRKKPCKIIILNLDTPVGPQRSHRLLQIAPHCSTLLQNAPKIHKCEHCNKIFSRNSNLTKHQKSSCKVKKIKDIIGQDFKCITPGIRPKGTHGHDQKRVMTPEDALAVGSDYLVIGRAITQAPSPKAAFQSILKDITNE